MISITNDYLINIIERCVSTTIYLKRNIPVEQLKLNAMEVTNEEITDFIISIPYLDIKLKDFIVGNLLMQTIIISQAWENEFIKKCIAWATNEDWLQTEQSYMQSIYKETTGGFLTLPY